MAEMTQRQRPLLPSKLSWLIVAILMFNAVLFVSQRFKWFSFNVHKGWTVLIALTCTGIFLGLFALWLTAVLLLRWEFRVSIRSLLTLFVVGAIPLGWLAAEMKAARRQMDAINWIGIEHGGYAYDWQCDAQGQPLWPMPNARKPPALPWLSNLLGDDLFADVVSVKFADGYPPIAPGDLEHLEWLTRVKRLSFVGNMIADAGLEHIRLMKELEYLTLADNGITDDGLKSLEGLVDLRMLDISDERISGPGLQHLGGMMKLRGLRLCDMPIASAGVGYLSGLTQLEVLNLGQTQITDADLEHISGLINLRSLALSSSFALFSVVCTLSWPPA
jgi:hypothetical protein